MSKLSVIRNTSAAMVALADQHVPRKVMPKLNWESRLNLILGLKGIGKTTYLLNQLSDITAQGKDGLYISLDDFYFLENSLIETIEDFHAEGGEFLFVDEVHYYENWDRVIKQVYDRYPKLKVSITGSSAINIFKSKADLSRRGHFYYMPGLSFSEYLMFYKGQEKIPPQKLEDLLNLDNDIVKQVGQISGIRKHFRDYLKTGYYPFGLESNINLEQQLKQLVETTVDIDLNIIGRYSLLERRQILALMRHIAVSAPYDLNVARIAKTIGVDRNKLISMLDHLERADLIHKVNLPASKKGSMSKPDKIFLNNSNLYHALHPTGANIGSMREAFAYNQLTQSHEYVELHTTADLVVDKKYTFEIGGKNKSTKQIKGIPNSFVLADDIEISFNQYRPLWILGLLY